MDQRKSKTEAVRIETGLGKMCTWHVLFLMIWTGWSLKKTMAMLGEYTAYCFWRVQIFDRPKGVFVFLALCHVKSSAPYRSGSFRFPEAICDQVSRSSPGISSCHNLRWPAEIWISRRWSTDFKSMTYTFKQKKINNIKNDRWSRDVMGVKETCFLQSVMAENVFRLPLEF